jgi:hypothetical protein
MNVAPDAVVDWEVNGAVPEAVTSYVNANYEWMREAAFAANSSDPYWFEVRLIIAQFEGLVAGYQQTVQSPQQNLTLTQILYLNLGTSQRGTPLFPSHYDICLTHSFPACAGLRW